jgi:oligopeptidase A
MQTLRQLEFGLFDFRLHHQYEVGETDIQSCLEEVQKEVSVVPIPDYARFANAFTHIFAGGYAAGYYSYKWAEVLSADAFSAFEEEGVFNAETGARFKTRILERGGAGDIGEMFKAFRGRMPSSEALLKQIGV